MVDGIELPYPDDPLALFRAFGERPWSIWLDSAGCGRFDLLVSAPRVTLVTRGQLTTICDEHGCRESEQDPLELVRQELARAVPTVVGGLPFSGGAVGYYGYDLARRYESLPSLAADDLLLPEMAVGIYDWGILVDHEERRCRLVGRDAESIAEGVAYVEALTAATPVQPRRYHVSGPALSNMTREAYEDAFSRIQTYLRDGDCYQVNFAQRFCAPATGDPLELYGMLREHNPAPFSAYLNLPFAQVMSASPERFLQVQGGEVETRPIKGTRRRVADPWQDSLVIAELRQSAKDRAENLMIVDLLRNDLGKNCAAGSVHVPQLFAVESFATVHHLVSTVCGRLAPGRDAIDLLRGCFPGGSITGAPKRRAMEIIEELEPHRRGIYCGSIGYIGFDGSMDTSIVIRTLVHHEDRVCFATGGGVVIDSTAAEEYQESLDKAAALLDVLERFRTAAL